MKNWNVLVMLFLVMLIGLVGCGSAEEGTEDLVPEETEIVQTINPVDQNGFWHSEIFDQNGFFSDIRALDYVDLFTYSGIPVPRNIHYISDYDVQAEVDSIIEWFQITERVYDRPVEDGDLINIDFIGSVDGVEFDGGNSGGMGMVVEAGSQDFIDDFLTQLIGAMPGSIVNVEVRFPDDYWEPSLAGEYALFITTVNFILGEAALTDADVVEHLSEVFGWTTVSDVYDGMRENMQNFAITNFVSEHIFSYIDTAVDFDLLPGRIIDFYDRMTISQIETDAANWGMEIDEYLEGIMGVESIEDALAMSSQDQLRQVSFALIMQAIAEDVGIVVTDLDLRDYFLEHTGSYDYSVFESMYGLPYLKHVVLSSLVFDYIIENILLQEA